MTEPLEPKDANRREAIDAIHNCVLDLFPTAEVRGPADHFDIEETRWRIVGLEGGQIRLRVSRPALEHQPPAILAERVRDNLPPMRYETKHRAIWIQDGVGGPVARRDDSEW